MKRLFFAAAAFLLCLPVVAQQQGTIDYTPDSCINADEMPVFRVTTHDDGILRAYFRRAGTTDWCSVDGENHFGNSTVVLPKVAMNDEIEYYFIVLNGKQVVAKSPQIYRARATDHCNTPFSRHSSLITLQCLPASANPTATALAAGYQARVTSITRPASPETPAH